MSIAYYEIYFRKERVRLMNLRRSFIHYINEKAGINDTYTDGLLKEYVVISFISGISSYILMKLSLKMISDGIINMFSWLVFILCILALTSLIHDLFVVAGLYYKKRKLEGKD